MTAPTIKPLLLPWPDRALHPNARVHWTPEEDEALGRAIGAARTTSEIAEASGRSKASVRNRAWRLGLLKCRGWSAGEIAALTDLYKRIPLDSADIAKTLGRSIDSIEIKAGRLGLGNSTRPKKRPEDIVPKRKHATLEDAYSAIGAATRARIARDGHPRGALGMVHSAETKELLGRQSSQRWAVMTEDQRGDYILKAIRTKRATGKPIPNPRGSWKAAWREVGQQRCYFRSRWEANYARYLEWLRKIGQISAWEHEAHTFWFDGIKRGCVSYLPDFRVTNPDGSTEWHEVKGWMDARSKTVLSRMAKYHPKEKLVLIREKQYMEIRRKASSLIEGWEQ